MCNGTLIDIKEPYSTMQLHEMLNILIFYIVFFFNAILQLKFVCASKGIYMQSEIVAENGLPIWFPWNSLTIIQ